MKTTLIAFLLITLLSCNGESTSEKSEKESYEKTKESLGEKEKNRPADFITVEGTDKHNIIGQTVIRGTLTNKGTVVKYKDIEVQLQFYSRTQTLLETDKEVIYEIIAPGESKKFKTKYFAPKGSDSVVLKVLSAKVAE